MKIPVLHQLRKGLAWFFEKSDEEQNRRFEERERRNNESQ